MKQKKVLAVLMLLVGMVSSVAAQSKQTYTGLVYDAATQEAVIGASVKVEGTTSGTITDIDGAFAIEAEENSTIEVSYIGYKTQVVALTQNVKVLLSEDIAQLDEVMVVAFGTSTKKSYTGSASVVKSDDIVKRQSSNITSSLQGQMAGVQGLSSSGQPGEISSIRIRGIGSINASNAPLYVVDGVPVTTDVIQNLANQDIESVTVLKDAASNALYGARGANGVILITTKRASSKEAQISFDAKWGTNQRAVPNYNVMVDPAMYYETYYKALYNGGLAQGLDASGATAYAQKCLIDPNQGGLGYQVYTVPEGQNLIGNNGKLNPNAKAGYVNGLGYTLLADNWYDELFNKNNFRQEYNLNIAGSTDKINYFASASFLDDKGIIESSKFQRVTARANVDYQAKKWLKVGTNMSYSHSDQSYPADDEYGDPSSGNLFYVANNMAPIYPFYIRDAEGKVMQDANGFTMYDYGDGKVNGAIRSFMSQSNPASAIQLDKSNYKKDLFNGKFFVAIEPYQGLKFTANLGVNYAGLRYNSLANPYYGQFATSGGYAYVASTRDLTFDQQYLATYSNKFAGLHQVDLLLGYENFYQTASSLSGNKTKLYSPDIAELNNAILSPSASSSTGYYKTQSILAQVKYGFADRYFISASYDRMASSRFASDKRWGNFWSVGAAWDIKGERWMDNATGVDQLKLKVSYGAQGNDALGNDYAYADQYSVSENNGAFATTLAWKGNPDLTWETSYNFNAGIDFAFLNERLSGTIEGWRRRTVDQLYYQPVPSSLGYSSIPVNIGSVSNAGLDLELRGDVVRTKNVRWGLFFNMTYFENKILKLADNLNGQWIEGSRIYKEGASMYNYYLRKYAGVDHETGAALWYIDETDEAGNVTTTTTTSYASATKYEIGDFLPKVYGGFGTNLEVYGVDLSVTFNFQAGGKVYDNAYANLMHMGYSNDAGHNWHMDILNAWTPENKDSNIPALNSQDAYGNSSSDRWLVSSDYVSLQNISLGYSFPTKLLNKAHINKLRLYAVADNVALWSARQGLDPRQGYTSNVGMNYAPVRTISGGLSITF